LIFVSFTRAVGITTNLIGLMAVIAVILLVFIVLFSFVSPGKEFTMPKGLTITFGVLIAAALIIALLVFTGYWDKIVNLVTSGNNVIANVIFFIVIIAAIIVVVSSGSKSSGT
jgi:hypothetical protein